MLKVEALLNLEQMHCPLFWSSKQLPQWRLCLVSRRWTVSELQIEGIIPLFWNCKQVSQLLSLEMLATMTMSTAMLHTQVAPGRRHAPTGFTGSEPRRGEEISWTPYSRRPGFHEYRFPRPEFHRGPGFHEIQMYEDLEFIRCGSCANQICSHLDIENIDP